MRNSLLALTLIAMLAPLTAAQDGRVSPPVTMRENTQFVSAQTGAEPVMNKGSYYPPFCPPKTCLYYAGDFETSYSEANGLFNADYESSNPLEGQTWVGVKPDRDVTVTGATFVEALVSNGEYNGVNPTPFAVEVGIKPGQSGKTVCSTSGTAAWTRYGYYQDIPTYSYTIKTLSKSCKLKKGRVYYVNLLPTSDNGYGYVWDVPPESPPNHHGWKNDLNDCYFNGAAFGANYVTCNSEGGGLSEFSIALTGKQTK